MSVIEKLESAAIDAEQTLIDLAWRLARGGKEPTASEVSKLLTTACRDVAWFKARIAEREAAVRAWRRLQAAKASLAELRTVPPPSPRWVEGAPAVMTPVLSARQREAIFRSHAHNQAIQAWREQEAKWSPGLVEARGKWDEAKTALTSVERRLKELRELLEAARNYQPERDLFPLQRIASLEQKLAIEESKLAPAQAAVREAEEKMRRLERELIALVEGTN